MENKARFLYSESPNDTGTHGTIEWVGHWKGVDNKLGAKNFF